jgi:glycosyltransferase involved in cell wall biosynthesis
MKFSIVTPSFRNSEWLKLCIASVADQDIEHEHIVQDSCSDDGTQDWLPHDRRVQAFIEKDRGMYDAVNRGFQRANGQYLAYINCDEQYLPGALRKVSDFMDAHPDLEVVFADTVVIAADGSYLCDRKAITPQKAHTMVGGSLSFLTCSTFIRQSVITERKLFFNDKLRDLGDGDWAVRLVENRVRMGVLREFTTVFTETGVNMNLLPNARREKQEFYQLAPCWARRFRPLVLAHFWMRRFFGGAYTTAPYQYSIYTKDSGQRRKTFQVDRPTFRWQRTPAPNQ